MLRQSLTRRCADEHDVEDVIQETLLRAARYRESLGDPARLAQWVVRIGRNVCRDRRRTEWRRRRRPVDEAYFEALPAPEPTRGCGEGDGGGVWIRGEEHDLETALELLGQALGSLLPGERSLLRSHYVAGRSCRESARRYGLPPALVKVRLFRLRRRLGREMERLVAHSRLTRLGVLEGVA